MLGSVLFTMQALVWAVDLKPCIHVVSLLSFGERRVKDAALSAPKQLSSSVYFLECKDIYFKVTIESFNSNRNFCL